MSQENVEAFWRSLDVFRRGDFDAWVDEFHYDAEFIPLRAPIQGAYRGHDGVREFLADNAENFDLFYPAFESARDFGDRVLAIGTIRVRGKGSGAEVEQPMTVVVTYRDGKIARFEAFGDNQEALEATGLATGSFGLTLR
jgi:ketosteroid isomerase-like protein